MSDKQFEREANYGAAMTIAAFMLKEGLISEKDYLKIDTIFMKKFKPIIGGLKA